ncbi:MAG: hypothetical protein PHE21_03500 [Candidatus Dojkabacteria bacterium]|nr:hypothetical protein [Candidatus Dojkabacteria bacterium]
MEEKTVIQETKKVSKAPLAILISFLILIILGLCVLVVGIKSNWDFKSFDFRTLFTKVATEVEEEEEKEITNDGWGLFKLPQYGFSVEIPDYKYKQTLGTGYDRQDVYSFWEVRHSTKIEGQGTYYIDNAYIETITLTFYPMSLPQSVACGQGCVNEHVINIDVYENNEEGEFSDIKKVWEDEYKDTYELDSMGNYSGEMTEKWGLNVWKYDSEFIGGEEEGYFIVTDDFIYHMYYFISQSPKASLDIANSVFDSMKFGE